MWSQLSPPPLPDEAYRARHQALRCILWAQLPLLAVLILIDDRPAHRVVAAHGPAAMIVMWAMAAALIVCMIASLGTRSRRTGATVVSLGLLLAAALMVSIGGGRTDLHFTFFIVVALISLYQQWLLLLLSIVLVPLHHLVMGVLAPAMLYSDDTARDQPVRFAVMHTAFVLAICAVQIVYWRFERRAQQESDQVRAVAEQSLRRNAERFEALVEDSADVIMVVERGGRIQAVNTAVRRIMGYPPTALVGSQYLSLIHPDDLGRVSPAGGEHDFERRAEARMRHADGAWHWHDISARNLCEQPTVAAWVVSHRDVTERREFQQQLVYEATHDALTGLANRAEFLRALQTALDGPPSPDTGLAVLYLDLDGFKQVNDTHGHEAGDALLVAVARALRRSLLGADTVGRLGGDEFAVVLAEIPAVDEAVSVAHRILGELTQPVLLTGGVVVSPRASIGIAFAARGSIETDALLHKADTAMYHAKRDATAGWQVHLDGMHDPSTTTVTLEDDLRLAVAGDQLRLHYQPVVALENGELIGFEALVRWEHPRLGLLNANDFIALAEQSKLIDDIGHWVLTHACRQTLNWQRRLAVPVRLSVNLSARQLEAGAAAEDLLAVLEEVGYPPAGLTVEVTESAVVGADALVSQLAILQNAGIRIALDDFGTGYSSLRYLARLPVDALKIDACFVAELDGTPPGAAVAEAVIRLGQILHLDTIAEGIEHPAQVTELTLLGCRAGQGFHYSHPLPAGELDAIIDATRPGAGPRFPVIDATAFII